VAPGAALELVMLLNHLRSDVIGGVGVDAERLDAEMVADGPPYRIDAECRQSLDLIEAGY